MNHIRFVKELPNGHRAVAVRAEVEPDPATIAEALQLPTSVAVLLLSGGAGGMSQELLERLRPAFEVVAQAVVQENATVIDGGTQAGVMKLMGEALARSGQKSPHIGVLPAYAEVEPGGPLGEDILEPCHSHFVLIDSDRWGSESKTMSDLATYLSAGAPSLALLVNGGEVALGDIEWNVRQGRRVVVLAGSGRVADEIAAAMRQPEGKARERIREVVERGRITLFDLTAPPTELGELVERMLTGGHETASRQTIG